MNLTQDFISKLITTAEAYDDESDPAKRVMLGIEIDKMADQLSEGQLRQVVKILLKS